MLDGAVGGEVVTGFARATTDDTQANLVVDLTELGTLGVENATRVAAMTSVACSVGSGTFDKGASALLTCGLRAASVVGIGGDAIWLLTDWWASSFACRDEEVFAEWACEIDGRHDGAFSF